jgi:WS/DGAT/MGAT family acyltransferase
VDRLSPLDARFVDVEDQDRHTSMAIASIATFEGPAPSYDELVGALGGRLPLVPRYRQKLRTVPLNIAAPVWVEDPQFDIRFHVRRTALPAPGGDAEIRALMGRVMAQRLDRDRPLWEYWFVEGVENGRWALISKVHHCMVDGVSGTDLYRVLFDASPEPSPAIDDTWVSVSAPSSFAVFSAAALDALLLPAREARAFGGVVRHPRRLAQQAIDTVRGVAKLASSGLPATDSSLTGQIGQQRRFTSVRWSLDEVKTIKTQLGGTVNDAVLAAITSGFRALLLSRDERPEPDMVPSLVPVSVRVPGEENILDNRVSAMLADLPVHLSDPVDRLAAIQSQLSALKLSKEANAGETMMSLSRYVPFPLASFMVRLALGVPQREIVTVTTNVPGPREPLYALGRRLVEIVPYVPIATTVRTGIAVFTYCDRLTIGITGDYDTTADLDVLAQGIEDGLAELLEAALLAAKPVAAKPRSRRSA